ncbi:hypothetical protein [Sporosarcina sp. ACRSL]|uniref:hypothetical protein n=1 Tax=Sporosarcina sp. ACRSL TaxID=2918215 RepID=UPI001EF7284B|nr:hypothetical protein [Sporosarcina sp. ACRSL]
MENGDDLMRLTLYTDYSLRVLMYLGSKDVGELSLTAYLTVLDKYPIADFLVNKDELAAILFSKSL